MGAAPAAARIYGHRPGQAPPVRCKIHGTDLLREVLAGATTFVSGMYIIVTNPAILQYILEREARP